MLIPMAPCFFMSCFIATYMAPDRSISSGFGSTTSLAVEIQRSLNPHPGGQLVLNVPRLNGRTVQGVQHKYRETVLFFPSQGQTCHAYCTYCFRWAQFVGIDELKFASLQAESLVAYLRRIPRCAACCSPAATRW